MKTLMFRLRIFLVIFLAVLIFGTIGFSIIENLSLTDAFYFTIITISTVGYGDMHPTTVSGKILAILMIVMGVGTFLGVIANASEIMLNNRERLNRINKLNMIIGTFFSEVGTELIIYLSNFDHNIEELRKELIIDSQYSKKSFIFLKNKLNRKKKGVYN